MENEAYVIYGESRKPNRISEEAEEHVCVFLCRNLLLCGSKWKVELKDGTKLERDMV